jgi:Protein of unknown function (DUF3277)
MASYSFLDVQCSVAGPNGSFTLGPETGQSEEGITVSYEGDKDTMSIGADGTPMHSLHASTGGTVSIRLQKTSPFNAILMAMYNADRISSAAWGQNTITVRDPVRGDFCSCTVCAFRRSPDVVYARDAGVMDWTFNAGHIVEILGDGSPVSSFVTAGINPRNILTPAG